MIQHKNCYSDVVDETRNICDDVNQLDCSKCVGNDCNIDTQQRGLKCFKCSGLTCFEPEDPSDVVGCVAPGCYVGLNGFSTR